METGGNSRYIRELAPRLGDRGLELTFISPARGGQLDWALFEAFALQRRAARSGARAVWYPMDTGPVRPAKDLPTLLTLHGAGVLHETTLRHPAPAEVWRRRARAAARAADRVITVSHASAQDVVRLAGPGVQSKLEVIPHGVGSEWFKDASADARAALAGEVDLNAPFAFFYGNIEPRKNLPLALEGLELVRESHPDLQFVVSGSPAWQSAPIVAELARRPWVRHIGRRSDDEVRALLHACRFFLFPSRYEGFGLPVLEALAAGAPVVASSRGAIPEVAGGAAFLFKEMNASQLADACARALHADRETVGRAGVAQAARFSWEESADRHLALINEL